MSSLRFLALAMVLNVLPFLMETGSAKTGSAPPTKVIEITIEQQQGPQWAPVSAQKVFHTNDRVRFRLKSQVSGYLYVLNHESQGTKTWLYPRPGTPRSNQIDASLTYVIPDTKGYFSVGGVPGFDVTYWMISPNALQTADLTTGQVDQGNKIRPRCDGALRARGDCEDAQAGPRAITDLSKIFPNLANSGGLTPRELSFRANKPSIEIVSPEAASGSIIYALWIAHD
jgi:hypothetical protein